MTLGEYIQAIERPLVMGEVRTVNLSDLYQHFQQGHFTPKDVLEFYRQRDSPRFIQAVKLFEEGKLFTSQMQSYDGWEAGYFAADDRARANDYLSLEDSAQQKNAEGTPANIRRFIFIRIYGKRPNPNDMGEQAQKIKDRWIAENKRFNWYWNSK